MQYVLYLGAMKIGHVVHLDSDFPSLWGTITYPDSVANPKTEEEIRFSRFLKLEQEDIRLIDVEHKEDVTKERSAIEAQMQEYLDYIETDDWYLIDETGNKHAILCPVLRHDGEIVWRWNPSA